MAQSDPIQSDETRKLRVAIAGASGFVGRALRRSLASTYELIALTRSQSGAGDQNESENVTWRKCDLFDIEEIKGALVGIDVVIYLVHSMSPQSRLTQARFEDLDLLLADNMRTACESAGVKRIIYLGGLSSAIEKQGLSRHLQSRREVGLVLGTGSPALTQLGAGVVIGQGGSSLRMLARLIKRLPVMVLPRWTATPTQPVSIKDVVRAFQMVLGESQRWVGDFDLGIAEEMTYGDMILRTAKHLGRSPITFHVPISSPKVSTLWIMLFSGEPKSLVFPLVSSLSSPTIARPNPLLDELGPGLQGFDQALDEAISAGKRDEDPRREMRRKDRVIINRQSLVRSVQRMTAPPDWRADLVCRKYWEWLGTWGRPLLRTRLEVKPGTDRLQSVEVSLLGGINLLTLERDHPHCSDMSDVLAIKGGLLVRNTSRNRGRFEFRRITGEEDTVVAVLHDYAPSLPWYLYEMTQALVHLVVMRAFRGWLSRRMTGPSRAGAAG